MADTKITALTALTGADPSTDVLPIVDTSDTTMAASGTTKKISINNILGASGTATLASATISGDLTVDTSTLKVLSSPNQVGIGTASPAVGSKLHVDGMIYGTNTVGAGLILFRTTDPTTQAASPYIKTPVTSGYSADAVYGFWYQNCGISNPAFESVAITTNASERYRIDSSGIATWSNVGGVAGTAMTLNSTGLGVGITPAANFHAYGSGASSAAVRLQAASGRVFEIASTGSGYGAANNFIIYDVTGATERLRIDTSGNVGIGVTPITSHILSCSGPIGISGTNSGTRTSYISNAGACSIYYTDGGGSGFFADFGNLIIQPRTSAARSVVIATGSTTPVERAVVKSTGQVRFVPLAADPAGAEAGDVYYNSTSNKLKCYNGTTWNDLF